MPEEWLDLVNLLWSNETIMNGRLSGGKIIKQTLTSSQLNQIESLQAAHDIEMQRLLRSFVND